MSRQRSRIGLPKSSPEPTVDGRVQQARRWRRRGDDRKAMLLLREASFQAGDDARLWTLYAAQCWRMRRHDDARQALRQALWFRERAGDVARGRVIRALLLAAEAGDSRAELRAA
jgi:Flp pilus assembly protein TadD